MVTPAKPAPPVPIDPDDLQALLDRLPAGREPLDVVMLDGYLCGVLLQPGPVPEAHWLARVTDIEGRPLPAGVSTRRLDSLVRRRQVELATAIAQRNWFDPWVYQLDDAASPSEMVMPWVAGFALALELFPELEQRHGPQMLEPLAGMFRHLPAEDLDDDALAAEIETLEPPAELAEAVEDLVRGVLLIADLSLPVPRERGGSRPGSQAPHAARRPAGRRR